MISVSIVGGSGYAGGELLRLLLFHSQVSIKQVTSERHVGKLVWKLHPNLRNKTNITFSSSNEMENCDVIFCCLPHGNAMQKMPKLMKKAPKIIDLSADFRLKSNDQYQKWYGKPHAHPELISKFVYGIPELHRDEMKTTSFVSGAGCNATATILALYPLYKAGIVDELKTVVEVKVGSSEAGNKVNEASHHPERSGCVRSFMPVGHRHMAEMIQELKTDDIHFSATAIDMVRGVLATCHVFLNKNMTEKEIWQIYRQQYGNEPFIRIVKDKEGIYRFPEPKLLMGSNICDIGFILDENTNRLVVISAIDNIMKGAAGQAVQAFNIMHGFDEKLGLEFPGLHPI